MVDRQSTGRIKIPADRGNIYDRHGQLVARNVMASSMYVWANDNRELRQVGSYLDKLYGYSPGTARKKFDLERRKFSWVQRMMPDDLANRVENEAPPGIHLRQSSRRVYPFGRVGKQILGFCDIDNAGLSGMEYAYDSLLSGKAGVADFRRDGLARTYRVKETAMIKPVPGTSVVLTIDWSLQDIVEDELAQAVNKHNAESGMAVFLDCHSGEILAIAHYDRDDPTCSKPTKLKAITDQFEPGSVFKPFTAAALLDAGVIDFNDSIDCEGGKWKMGRRTLHDDKEHDMLTFRQIIELSSNIGIGKCALKIPPEKLMETYRKFGFGQKLRCGLPGETPGHLSSPPRWSDYNVAAISMGHSVAVSALQIAAGFAAIANNGELLRPRLLLGRVDDDGYVVKFGDREVIGRAMKSSSVDSLKAMLRGVVEHGTAEPVNSDMVAIAGKTGTGEIPDLEHGGYYKHRFTASFGGFFPYEAPVVAGVVVLKNPKPVTYGGWTAGPAFKRIAERFTVLNPDLFSMPSRMLVEEKHRIENTVTLPNFVGRDVNLARAMAAEDSVSLRAPDGEGKVVWQFPPAGRVVFNGDEVVVAVESPVDSAISMVDLTGLPVRTVAAFLQHTGIKYRIKGSGRVVRQSIRPGTIITAGKGLCEINCRPT
jgi:cell division protein FtsI/penicillin-binding protein 2